MGTRRTVSLLLRDFHGGGAERAIINLANGLLGLAFDVDVVVLRDAGPFRRYLSPEARIVELRSPAKGPSVFLGIASLLPYLARRQPFRLVTTLEATTILASLASGILGRRDDLVIRVATIYNREPRPLLRRFLIGGLYRLHRGPFVVNSRESSRALRETLHIPEEQISIVQNAVDLGSIESLAAEEPEHRLECGKRYLLFVGRLTPAKRVDRLIRAFFRIHNRIHVDLLILGDGPLRGELARLITELGLEERVQMLGFALNPYAYMRRAAALVLSSDYEGMPTVLIEALACGCPVVSTDCPTGPREILEDGRWGELAPVGDVAALGDAIETAMHNPPASERLVERAQWFTIEKVAERYVELWAPPHTRSDE